MDSLFGTLVAKYPAPMTPTIWNTFLTTSINVVSNALNPMSRILFDQSPSPPRHCEKTHMTVEKFESTPVGILVAKVAMNSK